MIISSYLWLTCLFSIIPIPFFCALHVNIILSGHPAFLYEIIIWLGANNKEDITSRTDLDIIPLNIKSTDGIIESESALNRLFLLKQMHHITQYIMTSSESPIRYNTNPSSDHHPNHVLGIFIIMNAKHPNLPICSVISANLLFHLLLNSSLFLTAKIILGIIIIATKAIPKILTYSIPMLCVRLSGYFYPWRLLLPADSFL